MTDASRAEKEATHAVKLVRDPETYEPGVRCRCGWSFTHAEMRQVSIAAAGHVARAEKRLR